MKIVAGVFLLLALPSFGEDPHASRLAEAKVVSLENAWNQAIASGDGHALQPMLAEGIIYIDYDGRLMDKGQYLSHLKTPLLHPVHVVSESMQAHAYGHSVVVTGIYLEKGFKHGQSYALRERFIDTWIQQSGMWVCIASQSTLLAPARTRN